MWEANILELRVSLNRRGLSTEYHIGSLDQLKDLIEKALIEGNSIMVQPEYCGYFVLVWEG